MRIDIHTHAFHPKIAEKAIAQLDAYYGVKPAGTGLLDDLRLRMRATGIDRAVVHSAATTPEQVKPANDWAIHLQTHEPDIFAYGTVHPGYPDWAVELDRLASAGIRGLKLHPDFQGFWLDAPQMKPIYEAAAGRFAVMFHVGDEKPPEENFSCPYKIAAIKRDFPKLEMIAAHFGGYHHWEHVPKALRGVDIWIDTSSTLPFIDDALLAKLVRTVPRERWLFGSDYPLFDPARSLDELQRRLKLTPDELDELFSHALRFFP